MTLTDLLELYRTFKKDDTDMPAFAACWDILKGDDNIPALDWDGNTSGIILRGIPTDDRQAFDMAIAPLADAYELYKSDQYDLDDDSYDSDDSDYGADYDDSDDFDPDDVDYLQYYVNYDEYIELLELYIADKDKDIMKRRYPEFLKYYFVDTLRDKGPSEEEDRELSAALFRKFVDQYVAAGTGYGYEVKGYSCYGGSWAYECDWFMARDMIGKLLEKDKNPYAANSLGYIYYYGRCNDGKPQYEEALKYFMIGTAHGLYESAYKLGDMYYHGYGTPKLPDAAGNLYSWVYRHAKADFVRGLFETQFADAALRMGGYEMDSLVEYEDDKDAFMDPDDYEDAYRYLLEADYAIKLRIKEYDHYGDEKVAKAISGQLLRARQRYMINRGCAGEKPVRHDLPYEFMYIAEGRRNFKLRVKEHDDGRYSLTVSLNDDDVLIEDEKVLLTVPEKDYCRLVDEVTYITAPRSQIILNRVLLKEMGADPDQITVDHIDEVYDEIVFYDGTRWMARVKADYFELLLQEMVE